MQRVAAGNEARCNVSARITPYQAAKSLAINRSTLSRYLERYPDLLDDDGKVDFAELKRHRADNTNISEDKPAAPASKPSKPPASGAHANKHRLEEIKAWEAETDWAVKIGQLVDPAEFIDAAAEIGTALRDKLLSPDPIVCERLAEERDPRAIASILREISRSHLAETVAALAKIADETAPKLEGQGGD